MSRAGYLLSAPTPQDRLWVWRVPARMTFRAGSSAATG